jgi:hypothetical protein
VCYIDYDEQQVVWQEDVIIARKDHRCHCCHGTIRKGTAYTKHFSLSRDGDVTSEKQCGPCSMMVERFKAEHDGCPSQMPYQLNECVSEGDENAQKWKLEMLNMDRRARARERRLAKLAPSPTVSP